MTWQAIGQRCEARATTLAAACVGARASRGSKPASKPVPCKLGACLFPPTGATPPARRCRSVLSILPACLPACLAVCDSRRRAKGGSSGSFMWSAAQPPAPVNHSQPGRPAHQQYLYQQAGSCTPAGSSSACARPHTRRRARQARRWSGGWRIPHRWRRPRWPRSPRRARSRAAARLRARRQQLLRAPPRPPTRSRSSQSQVRGAMRGGAESARGVGGAERGRVAVLRAARGAVPGGVHSGGGSLNGRTQRATRRTVPPSRAARPQLYDLAARCRLQ